MKLFQYIINKKIIVIFSTTITTIDDTIYYDTLFYDVVRCNKKWQNFRNSNIIIYAKYDKINKNNKNIFHKYLKHSILLLATENYMYFFRYWRRVVDNYDTRSIEINTRTL